MGKKKGCKLRIYTIIILILLLGLTFGQARAYDFKQIGNIRFTGVAGEAITKGQLVVIKSDGLVYKADANGSNTQPAIGIATSNTSSGDYVPITNEAIVSGWSGLTIGGKGYLSETAGAITQSVPASYSQAVGTATTSTRYYIRIAVGDADTTATNTKTIYELDANDPFTVTTAYAGQAITNGATFGPTVCNLPEASTCIGQSFTFITTAAYNFDINPDDADQILALTNAAGDCIRNATAGNNVVVTAIDDTYWVALPYGTWADAN